VGAPLLGALSEQIGPRATLGLAGVLTALACVGAGAAMARHLGLKVRPYELGFTLREALGLPTRSAPAPVPVSVPAPVGS
jgi:hypothetical protein